MTTRYVLHDQIGAGGMATVHLGQLIAPLGFARLVAVKRLRASLAKDARFAAMLIDEARIAARVRHPNVISTLDVLVEDGECLLVMEYVEGESLARLLQTSSQREQAVPPSIVVAVLVSVLHGLHAAHNARSPQGEPLGIIHRDVSPQNILIGTDGVARVFDFGIAKAAGCLQQTQVGEFKGKLAYVAPERLRGMPATQSVDIYSAAVVLWETLTGTRLFNGSSEDEICEQVLRGQVPRPSEITPGLPEGLDEIVLRGLAPRPEDRFPTAERMAAALESTVMPATMQVIESWVRELAAEALAERAALVANIEAQRASSAPAVSAASTIDASSATEPAAYAPPGVAEPEAERSSTRGPRAIALAGLAACAVAVAAYSYVARGSSVARSSARLSPARPVLVNQAAARAPAHAAKDAAPIQRAEPKGAAPSAPSAQSGAAQPTADQAAARPQLRAPSTSQKVRASRDLQKPARVVPPSSSATPAPAAPRVTDCSPPYVIRGGIKRFKPECF